MQDIKPRTIELVRAEMYRRAQTKENEAIKFVVFVLICACAVIDAVMIG